MDEDCLSGSRKLTMCLLPLTWILYHPPSMPKHTNTHTHIHRKHHEYDAAYCGGSQSSEKEEKSGLYESVSCNETIMAPLMLTS